MVSTVIKRMGSQWSSIVDRVREFASVVPDEGMSGGDFEKAVLTDVDPRNVDDVLWGLHRRKIVYVSRNRGAVIVYRDRPPSRYKPDWAISTSPEGKFVSNVAPHVFSALSQNTAYSRIIASDRIMKVCRSHEKQGLSLPDMRAALWAVFHGDIMKMLAARHPVFQLRSLATNLPVIPPKQRRLPRGSTVTQKLLAMIEKAGAPGINITALKKGLALYERPSVDEALSQCEEQGLVVSSRLRVLGHGRTGRRFFSAKHGLPYVDAKGLAHIK